MKEAEPGEFSSATPWVNAVPATSDEPTDVFYKLWLEWDYGQDDVIFNEQATAKAWFGRQLEAEFGSVEAGVAKLLFDDFKEPTVDRFFDEGLASFQLVTLIKE